jgi:hypothetical protein
LAFEEVVTGDVVLSLTLPLRIGARSICALAAAPEGCAEEGDEEGYIDKLQKRHTL